MSIGTLVNLVFGKTQEKSSVGALKFDALLSEATQFNAKATQYVVEDGSPISDHISQESIELRLTGVITSAKVNLWDGESGLPKLFDAKEVLRDLHEKRELVSVVTGLDVYDDMAITDCRIERNGDDGYLYNVDITLVKIRKAKPSETEVPEAEAKKADAQGKATASKSAKKGTGANGKAGKTKAAGGRVSNTNQTASASGTTQPSTQAAAKAGSITKSSKLHEMGKGAGFF